MAREIITTDPKIVKNADESGSLDKGAVPGRAIRVEGGRVVAFSVDATGMKDLERRAQEAGKTVEEIATADLKGIINW